MASPSTFALSDLAAQISSLVSTVNEQLKKHNAPQPSFVVGGLVSYPTGIEIDGPRMALAQAAQDLYHLAVGPVEYMKTESLCVKHDLMAWQVLDAFNIYDAVPVEGSATYSQIASKTGLSEDFVKRILRMAMTTHVFDESVPGSGEVIHTATSLAMQNSATLRAWVSHNIDDVGPGCAALVETVKKHGSDDLVPSQSALIQRVAPGLLKDDQTLFDWFVEDGEGEEKGWRMKRFGDAMKFVSEDKGFDIGHIHKGFDWDSLGEAKLVDIGGSIGHISIELASKHRNLTCVVQDFPGLEPQFNNNLATLAPNLAPRVSFQPHNFFTPQPIKDAQVFLLKHILHDWPNPSALKIIRAIVPVLSPGDRIMVIDGVFPGRGALPPMAERVLTSLDLQMKVCVNAKERNGEEWVALFEEADPRLEVRGIVVPAGSVFAVIEVVFDGHGK